jgi:hypothetical protein
MIQSNSSQIRSADMNQIRFFQNTSSNEVINMKYINKAQ